MAQQQLADVSSELTKAAPPLAVSGATLVGMTPERWVLALTAVYLLLQIGWLVWRWWRAARTKGWRPNE